MSTRALPSLSGLDGISALLARLTGPSVNHQLLRKVAGIAGFIHEITQCRSTSLDCVAEHFFDLVDQGFETCERYAVAGTSRMNAGGKERFGGVDVTDTDDDLAVHDQAFDRCSMGSGDSIEIIAAECIRKRF